MSRSMSGSIQMETLEVGIGRRQIVQILDFLQHVGILLQLNHWRWGLRSTDISLNKSFFENFKVTQILLYILGKVGLKRENTDQQSDYKEPKWLLPAIGQLQRAADQGMEDSV